MINIASIKRIPQLYREIYQNWTIEKGISREGIVVHFPDYVVIYCNFIQLLKKSTEKYHNLSQFLFTYRWNSLEKLDTLQKTVFIINKYKDVYRRKRVFDKIGYN